MSIVAVIDSGSGNLRSVERALHAAGGTPLVTADPEVVRRADRIVVPGQGAFADCVAALKATGLDQAIREFIAAGRPYLGICLGLQVLFDDSEEHGPVRGLGILPGHVVRFRATCVPDGSTRKVPHMGWNCVTATGDEPLLASIAEDTHFYFIHSYYVDPADNESVALWCEYGVRFAAAVRKDNIFACQFHPEKSQHAGLALLANFLETG